MTTLSKKQFFSDGPKNALGGGGGWGEVIICGRLDAFCSSEKKKIIFDYISHNCDPPLVFITFENVSGPN